MMESWTNAGRVVLAVAVVHLVATGTAQAQSQVGTYTLVEVNGNALPVTTDLNRSCTDEVHAATLTILEGSRWQMTYTETETCGAEVDEDIDEVEGGYIVRGDAIIFSEEDESDDRPEEIDLDELEVGRLTDDGIEIVLQDRRSRLRFQRQ